MSPGKQVIVGGLGNLGRHMQRTLLSRGLPTTVVDRADCRRHNVSNSVNFVPHHLGVDDPVALRDCLKGADTVYSMLTPDVQFGSKRDFAMTNEIGVSHLVEVCKNVGVPKFVYVSSIAVTNHFVSSIGQNESDPLPDLGTYLSTYDLTKRKGEETVLRASDGSNFQTCSLRMGGLLAGMSDYTLRNMLCFPGRVISAQGKRIDYIYAGDFCRALLKASETLNDTENDLAGRALFVTKCRDAQGSPQPHEIAEACADLMGRSKLTIPSNVFSAIQAGARVSHMIFDAVSSQDDESKYAIPPHLFMDILNYEQTFDNSLARTILGFEPEFTWKEALEHIVGDASRNNSSITPLFS